ncbi:MAG: phage terminase large subunit [Bacteroidetes bacterium]|nr:phage terminase large subunit [Bacteroidota bacterium]
MVDNWHIKYICDILQEETERIKNRIPKEKDIIINVPPRSLKSFIVSICWPAWSWIPMPSMQFIGTSYSSDLAIEHNVKCRRLIESDWYTNYWGNKVILTTDQNTKGKFENTHNGFRRATSTGGTLTGTGGNIIFCDDPINPKKAVSEVERKNAIDFFTQTLSTRLNEEKIGLFLIIMQRLHEDDLTGYLLQNEKNNYRYICLPGELENAEVYPKSLEKNYQDGLLFPARFPKDSLQKLKSRLGSFGYAGQILQQPSPEEGGVLKKAYWQYYNVRPKEFEDIFDSWDMTFKDLHTSDYVVGTVWGRIGANCYLLHMTRKRMGFVESIKAVLAHRERFPKLKRSLIEDKANGTAIIELLKKKITGILAYNPGTNSKIERAHRITPQLEAGNVFVPVKQIATFDVESVIDECAKFPNGVHDDIVDSISQALIWADEKKSNTLDSMGWF